MKFSQGKIFLDKNNRKIVMKIVPNGDYYSFVRESLVNGLKQVILPSDVLISTMQYLFKKKKAEIVHIEFLEEDDEYNLLILKLIDAVKDNRDYFIDLMEELNYLSGNQTAEIKCIRMKYRENGILNDISLSVNGLINFGENLDVNRQIEELNQYIWEKMHTWL